MVNDNFGIKQIYPSASTTSEFYNLSSNPASDGRVIKVNSEVITPVGGTTTTVTPTETPPATSDYPYEVIWDSNVHGNWDDGNPRTVDDEEGDTGPDGKGFYTAASGDPRLIIDGDGVAHLEADPGHGRIYIMAFNYNARIEYDLMFEDTNIDSHSGKFRSRHQEGGDCSNRFGGFGWSLTRTSCEFQTESCHNNHENSINGSISPALQVGQWYRIRVDCYNNAANTEVNFSMQINRGSGFQTVLTGKHTSPDDFYMDRESFLEDNSYIWLRINNEDDTGSVAFRDVVLMDLDSPTTGGGGTGGGGGGSTTVTNPSYFIVSNTANVRLNFLTTAGQPTSADCAVNYTNLDTSGFRFSNKDWKNVEFTGLFFVQTVTDKNSGIYMETRSGRKVEPRPCCDGHSYGLRVYWNDDANDDVTTGRIEFAKFMHWSSSFNAVASIVNPEVNTAFPNFYRRWFGVKLIVYNIPGPNNEKYVKLEFWLCPSDSAADLESGWFKIIEFVDTGLNWGSGGTLCGGTDKQAITWGSYLSTIGWDSGTEVRFKKVSVREINPTGTFPDSTAGGDGLYNDLTVVYNINSDSDGCICSPPPFVPPPPTPGGGGGTGGGPINSNAIYDIPHTGSGVDAEHLGQDSGNSSRYLQYGIEIVGDDSQIYNKAPKRIEIPLKKLGNPNGVATIVVRNGVTNAIETTLGTIDATEVQTTTQYYSVENLASTYQIKIGDMILIEYDQNDDEDDYLICFTKPVIENDVRIVKRSNTQSPGNYTDRNLEFAWRIYA